MFENEMDENLVEENQELMQAEGLNEEIGESPEEVVPSDLEPVQIRSILESVLLASDKPLGLSFFKEVFKGTNAKTPKIKEALENLTLEYAGAERGLTLIEVGGGFQLRTKPENSVFVRRMMKGRPFKLSGPALEVLAIISYKQPIIKAEVDEIRGVELGHLMRALMDRGLIRFDGKSELPGKPMLYGTTRKFLEIFGLKDIRELPSLSEIDQLLPDGIGDDDTEKEEKLGDMQAMGLQYQPDPEREVEWEKISADIADITTTTDFFEKEKERQREERDIARADGIREALALGEEVEAKEIKWLTRFDAKRAPPAAISEADAAAEAAAVAGDGSDNNIADVAETIDNDALDSEVSEPEAVSESAVDSIVNEQGEKVDAGKLSEILEGLKSKNSKTEDSTPSEREHLNKSVYRPDQLAQALKDFDSEDEK